MELKLVRLHDNGDTTIGAMYINGVFDCFIIEDQENTNKVYGETRIPEGVFNVSFRKEGTFHAKYAAQFGADHYGMLCVHNAPNWKIEQNGTTFQYVLIHIGNTDEDTAGCLLPNDTVSVSTAKGSGSTVAYKKLYKRIAAALLIGDKVTIEVVKIEDL